jgi:LPXTG-motif cell wall-anchored protein
MGSSKLVGIVLLVVGIALLYFGFQSTQSVGDQISETFTGRFTDNTMWYLIGGAALVAAGGFLALFKK